MGRLPSFVQWDVLSLEHKKSDSASQALCSPRVRILFLEKNQQMRFFFFSIRQCIITYQENERLRNVKFSALCLVGGVPVSFRKFRKKTEEGVGSAAPVAVLKASSAALPDSLCLIFMGAFNWWIYLYLKAWSNCRCNCSSPMLTTVRTQTKTHCEWPEVPRYPLHQHTCSRAPLGIAWRRPIWFWTTRCQPCPENGVQGAFLTSFTQVSTRSSHL